MVRKQTWVLVGVFIALLGVLFYTQKNPAPDPITLTPSPTPLPSVFTGWQAEEINWIEYKTTPAQGAPIELANQGEGKWVLGKDGGTTVDSGKVAMIVAQILDTHAVASLPADYSLDAVGLQSPAAVLTIRNHQEKQAVLKIGSPTPTGSGYYVQVDDQAPMVVGTAVIDQLQGFLSLDNLLPPTPTPAATLEPAQPTATP